MSHPWPDWPAPDEVATHPLVRRARTLAADVLAPTAAATDAAEVDRERVDLLAGAGLLGVTAAHDLGGGGATTAVGREVTETLAGACGATWFVTAQHQRPLAAAASSDHPELAEAAARLATGEWLGAVAFTHLRRPGPPPVSARPDPEQPGAWLVDGRVDWVTSWGLADVVLLGAETVDGRVLFALVPARDDGWQPGPRLRPVAMAAARTVSATLTSLGVPGDRVVELVDRPTWEARDAAATATPTPAAFGLLRALCGRLAVLDPVVADDIAGEAVALRARADELADAAVAERLAVRARQLTLLQRASAAYVAASGGQGLVAGQPAERLAREALFHLVTGQTDAVRRATLARLAG